MELREDDLVILQKETNLSRIATEDLLKECNGDVVDAILKHNGELVEEEKPPVFLTEAQQQIKKLRDIVDKKDEMLDNMMAKQKA